ncbi:PWWP domain-containing protein 2A [Polymixia lowei]
MAAVAAEPGAAVVPTTTTTTETDDEGQLEPGPVGSLHSGADPETDVMPDYRPAVELLVSGPEDGDVVAEECGHVRPEREAAAGKEENNVVTTDDDELLSKYAASLSGGGERLILDRFPPAAAEPELELGCTVYRPLAVFLHSIPAHAPVTEAGLSLAEPAEPEPEPTTNITADEYYQNQAEPRITRPADIGYTSLIKPDLRPEPAAHRDGDVVPENQEHAAVGTAAMDLDPGTDYSNNSNFSSSSLRTQQNSVVTVEPPVTNQPGSMHDVSPSPCCSPKHRLAEPPDFKQEKTDSEPTSEPCSAGSKPPAPCHDAADPASVEQLTPGSEVRVSLDHIIDDALVVSFRVGEKVFSGVLMDLSKRFGPYGIPITVFPKRDYKDRPQPSMQLHPPAQQQDVDEALDQANRQTPQDIVSTHPPKEQILQGEETQEAPPPPPPPPPLPPPHPWSSKPPPLFQEGAPYPPPLFIRDTYNQALPQPLPRKIKRPKRRYRCEEPTSIMNAIKLRPRQVLCDKCKGVVSTGAPREARRGPLAGSEPRGGEETSRRRRPAEGGPSSVVGKRLRSEAPREEKGGRASGLRVSTSSSSSSGRVLRAVSSSSSSSSSSRVRLKLSSKQKVLAAKGSAVECSKARQVLNKLSRTSQQGVRPAHSAPPPPQPPPHHRRQPRDGHAPPNPHQNQTPPPAGPKTMTRAAALQVASQNQKVHFTRRLQHLSTAAVVGSSPPAAPLPPRLRLKPQRYRTDDSQASSSSSSSSSPPKQQPGPSARTAPPKPTLSSAHSPAPALPPAQAPPPHSALAPDVPACPPMPSSSSGVASVAMPPSLAPPPRAQQEGLEDRGKEEEEGGGGGGGEAKRRRKSSSSSSCSSSSSSKPSMFSKSVSKCSGPDGRTVCVGDIVWAKIYGFPWWPARVLAITVARRDDTGLAVRQEARVSWFGSPTTSFLPLAQLAPFLESFQSRFDRKRKGPYRRAITEAARAAKQLTPEVRALLTQFET